MAGLSDRLLATGAYRDLPTPAIVTSGEFLTPFYVNAERLTGDPAVEAVLEEHGESDERIIAWACERMDRDPGFADTIRTVAAEVGRRRGRDGMVCGGQRRDWLFSGPVARHLGCGHVSLYKQAPGQGPEADRIVVRQRDLGAAEPEVLGGRTVVPVVDMLTAASSCWRVDPTSGREMGWVPLLRDAGARVRDLVAVVSRRQGGEEALGRVGVRVRSCARVDREFLRRYSRKPEDAVAYYRDPVAWTAAYLEREGIDVLLGYLAEDPRKLPRLLAFASRYRRTLARVGQWDRLDRACRERLGRGLEGGSGADA